MCRILGIYFVRSPSTLSRVLVQCVGVGLVASMSLSASLSMSRGLVLGRTVGFRVLGVLPASLLERRRDVCIRMKQPMQSCRLGLEA